MEDTDVPRALVKRIVKAKIAVLDSMASEEAKKEVQLNKDAILALSESAKIFITYLTATANDICRESKRQIISADDIFAALTDLDFSQLVAPLNQALEAFKVENKEKNKKKAEQVKKRKASKVSDTGDAADVQAESSATADPTAAIGLNSVGGNVQHQQPVPTVPQQQAMYAPVAFAGAAQLQQGTTLDSSNMQAG